MPIVGHGDIASALTDRYDRLYFASGVSNSQCTDWHEFQREKELLMVQNKMIHLVYFSSLSIYYADTPYTRHKMIMENLVKKNFNTYTIVRIGNITWGKNPNTFINYLRQRIKRKLHYGFKDEYRYIINKPTFKHWMNLIPEFSNEMNLPGQMIKPKQLFNELGITGVL